MPYHIKNVYQNPGPKQSCNSITYYGNTADIYDPNALADYKAALAGFSWPNSAPPAQTMVYFPEEADDMFGLDQNYTHTDMGFMILAQNPMQVSDGQGFTYPDHTLYSKMALKKFLANKYGTIGALNTAWGTNYTTFDTSDPAGDTGIQNGTYASYGTGTGLLDESGSGVLPSDTNCNLAPSVQWASHPQIQADVDAFVAQWATTYGQILSQAITASVPQHPAVFLPLYDAPAYVYSAIVPYVDGFWVAVNQTPGSAVQQVQTILNASSKPIIVNDYSVSNPDSPLSAFSDASCTSCPPYADQSSRGKGMVAWWQSILGLKNAQGLFGVVGVEHWQLYDNKTEQLDFGFATSTFDNPYDGSANTNNGEAANYGDLITPIQTFLNGNLCDP